MLFLFFVTAHHDLAVIVLFGQHQRPGAFGQGGFALALGQYHAAGGYFVGQGGQYLV